MQWVNQIWGARWVRVEEVDLPFPITNQLVYNAAPAKLDSYFLVHCPQTSHNRISWCFLWDFLLVCGVINTTSSRGKIPLPINIKYQVGPQCSLSRGSFIFSLMSSEYLIMIFKFYFSKMIEIGLIFCTEKES